REQPTLLLKDDDVPLDVAQKLRQTAVLVSLAQAPSWCGVLDGIDRLSSGIARGEVVYERRQGVLEGEAAADEQHAQAWLAAARKREVPPQGRSKQRTCESDVDEPGVDGEPEHEPCDGVGEQSQRAAHAAWIGSDQTALDPRQASSRASRIQR